MTLQEKTTRDKFNYLKKYYDETWDEASHTLHVGLFKSGHDSLREAYDNATSHLIQNVCAIAPINEKSTILDIGCGTGRTLIEVCIQFGCMGVGVDLSDEQIKDAREHLKQINKIRASQELPKLKTTFIRGSGSDLEKSLKKDGHFTHIISQDAILLVSNKQSLFENVNRLLAPGGVLGVADFLSENAATSMSLRDQQLIYSLVNWTGELSYKAYHNILSAVGLNVVKSERHDTDMIRTYQMLADKMRLHTRESDKTYVELKDRYEHIVNAVKRGKMGWGFFFAQKPVRKTVLLAGTKEKSIGRYLGKFLHELGWEVWLYSRTAQKVDTAFWHERKCDISDEKSIERLLDEIQSIDLIMMLADSGDGHGKLESLSEKGIKGLLNAKLVGSALLAKALALKFVGRKKMITMVWCAGKQSNKSKDLILYGMVNAGLGSLIEGLNNHYNQLLQAYYLPTNLTSPSTIGDEYITKAGEHFRGSADHPQVIADMIVEILDGKYSPGLIDLKKEIL